MENQTTQTPETKTPQSDVLPTGAATEQTSPVLPTPPVPEPPKKNWGLIVGIVVLVLAILGAGGYFAYQNYLVSKPSPTPISSPSPTPDVTANWKTYTDDRFNFSIEYPQDWKTLPYPDNWEPGAWVILAYSPGSKTSIVDGKIIGVIEGQSTFLQIIISNKSQVTVKDLENLAIEKGSSKTEQIINQIEGLLITYEEKESLKEKMFIFEKEDKTFIIQLGLNKEKSNDEKILDQILSTFKFTSANLDSTNNYIYLAKNLFKHNSSGQELLDDPYGDIVINSSLVTKVGNNYKIGESIYSVGRAPGGGPCGMAEDESNCYYADEEITYTKIFRIWTNKSEGGVFLLNPQSFKVGGYFADIIIEKISPNKIFTTQEIETWKKLLNSAQVVQHAELGG